MFPVEHESVQQDPVGWMSHGFGGHPPPIRPCQERSFSPPRGHGSGLESRHLPRTQPSQMHLLDVSCTPPIPCLPLSHPPPLGPSLPLPRLRFPHPHPHPYSIPTPTHPHPHSIHIPAVTPRQRRTRLSFGSSRLVWHRTRPRPSPIRIPLYSHPSACPSWHACVSIATLGWMGVPVPLLPCLLPSVQVAKKLAWESMHRFTCASTTSHAFPLASFHAHVHVWLGPSRRDGRVLVFCPPGLASFRPGSDRVRPRVPSGADPGWKGDRPQVRRLLVVHSSITTSRTWEEVPAAVAGGRWRGSEERSGWPEDGRTRWESNGKRTVDDGRNVELTGSDRRRNQR